MTGTEKHFDIAIIGTGSGNTIIDGRFDDKTVAMFEESTFGGTCINVGCIPTKMFVYAAEVAEMISHAERFGIDAHIDNVRWTDIVDRVFGRIDPIAVGGEKYRADDSKNVTLFRGHARFLGPRRIDTGTGDVITADQVVIAAGSRPIVPKAVTDSGVAFHTNDDIMRLPELPEHLIIIGGGYIASEFAHIFSALGSRVSIVSRSDRLLRHLDAEVSDRFTELAAAKWDVHFDVEAVAFRTAEGGGVVATLSDGTDISADALLVATGRAPNGDRLSCDAAGVDLRDDGRIAVDEFGRTSADGVFALGDVSSPYQLKHVANAEARVVQHNLLRNAWTGTGDLMTTDHRFVPAGVFTDPQIASVGMTEGEAKDSGLDITVKVQDYSDVAYGWAMEDHEGFCKVIAEKGTGRILGAHIIGAQATSIIQPLIQAMSFGQSVSDVAHGQYWIHPGLPEVVENALLGLDI